MSSLFYFIILLGSVVLLAVYLWLSARTQTLNSWIVVSTLVMLGILLAEGYRETIVLSTGHLPTLTHIRAAILRLEHTYLGFFLGEVMQRVRTILLNDQRETG